jgi:hypothetical protein
VLWGAPLSPAHRFLRRGRRGKKKKKAKGTDDAAEGRAARLPRPPPKTARAHCADWPGRGDVAASSSLTPLRSHLHGTNRLRRASAARQRLRCLRRRGRPASEPRPPYKMASGGCKLAPLRCSATQPTADLPPSRVPEARGQLHVTRSVRRRGAWRPAAGRF